MSCMNGESKKQGLYELECWAKFSSWEVVNDPLVTGKEEKKKCVEKARRRSSHRGM